MAVKKNVIPPEELVLSLRPCKIRAASNHVWLKWLCVADWKMMKIWMVWYQILGYVLRKIQMKSIIYVNMQIFLFYSMKIVAAAVVKVHPFPKANLVLHVRLHPVNLDGIK